MKTFVKDIILICKGYFDREKYPSIFDALKAYYCKNYFYEESDDINERFLLRVLLIEVMNAIAREYPDRIEGFISGFLVSNQYMFYVEKENAEYDYQLFYRIVNYLLSIDLQGDGLKSIDVSAYFKSGKTDKLVLRTSIV